MLTAAPKSMFSWNFTVQAEGRAVAELSLAWMRERGRLTIDGVPFEIESQGILSGAWQLTHAGSTFASAAKPSMLTSSFDVEYAGESYVLERASWLGRGFRLQHAGRTIGTIRPVAWLSRRLACELPGDLPRPLQVFLIWLVIVMWRRLASSK